MVSNTIRFHNPSLRVFCRALQGESSAAKRLRSDLKSTKDSGDDGVPVCTGFFFGQPGVAATANHCLPEVLEVRHASGGVGDLVSCVRLGFMGTLTTAIFTSLLPHTLLGGRCHARVPAARQCQAIAGGRVA